MRHYFPNTISLVESSSPLWHPCVKANSYHQAVQLLSISPNGKMVITGHLDGSVCLQDAQTGSHISGPLVGHTNPVTCITFSLDGKLAASSSYDTTIRLWDVSSKAKIASHVLAGHSGPVNSVTFHPGAALLASGLSDRTIRFWNTKSMSPIGLPYTEHSDGVTSTIFSPDGTKLVSGSSDRTIRVWSVDIVHQKLSINPLVITGHSDSITCVAVSPNGTKIVSGSIDKTVRMWDAGTGEETSCKPQTNHHMSITCVRFSPCGKLVASSSLDGGIQLYSTKTMNLATAAFRHSKSVNSIEFLPNGLYVMSGSSDMTTRMWEIDRLPSSSNCHREMAVRSLVGHTLGISCIAISNDGTRVISSAYSPESDIRMWDAQTGKLIGSPLTGHSNSVRGVAISPDNTHILSGSEDRTLKLWNTATQTTTHPYVHTSAIWCVAFSPDGTLVAFGCRGGDVYMFEAAGWKVPGTALRHSSSYAFSVAFLPDGATLASAYSDGTIALWNVATRSRSIIPLSGHIDYVRSVAFSPCGTQLASGSDDWTVQMWDVKKGDMMRELKGHTNWVTSVAFSHNGLYIASGSHDKTVRLWNAKTGELIGQPFAEHSDLVEAAAFSPNDDYLISGLDNKTISVQRINTPPGTFYWPLNPYNLSPHSHYPGWLTSNYEYLSFWLPPHYQRPGQFLSSSTENPCPQTLLDYSKFVQGDTWMGVASESIRQSMHSSS
ncbi:WD domain, G-beta repeat, partial [Rhizoctonia solani]